MRGARIVVLASAALLTGGCIEQPGTYTADRFVASDSAYTVEGESIGGGSILGAEWVVENFDASGSEAKEKLGSAYKMVIEWVDESGHATQHEIRAVDLIMRHQGSNAVIWSRMLFVPHALRGKALDVLAENYANNITGGRFYAGYLNNAPKLERVGTEVLTSYPNTVNGYPAHSVVFDLADIDQLEMSRDAPRTRAEVVLVGAEFKRPLGLGTEVAYMLLGYGNDASRFADQHPAFQKFVRNVRLSRVTGEPYGRSEETSAGRLRLGMSVAQAKKACEVLNQWTASGHEATCTDTGAEGFDTPTRLTFCGDAVCALEYAVSKDARAAATAYPVVRSAYRGRCAQLKETKNIPEACEGSSVVECLKDGRASVRATCALPDGSRVSLDLGAKDGTVRLLVTEKDPTKTPSPPAEPVRAAVTSPPAEAPPPTSDTKPEPKSEPGGSTRICAPGITQQCFGRGGCKGGQACADDGTRWLPCDCGG